MKNIERESLASEPDNEDQPTQKQSQQFKALFFKNLRLQSKQMGTNLCQIFTPILCIIFTYLMKTIAEGGMPLGTKYGQLQYPIKFGDYNLFDQKNPNLRKYLQWTTYQCVDNCNQNYLGINNGNNRSGLLGQVPLTTIDQALYYPNIFQDKDNFIFIPVPFFLETNYTSMNQMLFDRLSLISKTDYQIIKHGHALDYLPDGAYSFTTVNNQTLKFDVKVNDERDLDTHQVNGLSRITQFKKSLQTGQVDKVSEYNTASGLLNILEFPIASYIKTRTNKTLGSGYYYMPEDDNGVTFVDTIISFVAVLVFPISLSLLFPVFLYTVVLEKQEKLIQMMKMNGMKIRNYWAVYFCFNLILSIITNLIFVMLGYFLTGMRLFTETDPLLLFFTLFGWSLAQIGLAVFFQTFLNQSRSANIIGYLISIWMSMIASSLNIAAYQFPLQCPKWMQIFGPTAFVRIIYLMLMSCADGKCYGNIQHIPEQMKVEIAFLYLNFIFFFLLGSYLFEIIPQQFGVTRSPLFPIKSIIRIFKSCLNNSEHQKLSDYQIQQDAELRHYINKHEEDPLSKKQRSDILTEQGITQKYPLVINNLRKLYQKEGRDTPYPAVRSFNLKIGARETFGLLGPNGAGKTTLISMLTGMYEPNYGNAWIGGYDIKTTLEKAQLEMGVCPQFDLLWPQLTVQEHLYFYARLKGIPSKLIKDRVIKAIEEVKLTKFTKFESSSLSGGMKRRLSFAISLVGDPRIVFLDEPSTGLDPENRRQLWEVLAKCQKKRAILLTTHMMEEADILCNRIGILTSGVLRTVGPQTTLKNLYGGGYRMTISTVKQERALIDRDSLNQLQPDHKIQDLDDNYDAMKDKNLRRSIDSFVEVQQKQKKIRTKKRVQALSEFMQAHFKGSNLVKQFNGCLIFQVPSSFKVSEMFGIMEKMEKELDVVDVAITNSSLQDVFMNVVIKYEIEVNKLESQKLKGQQSQNKNQEQFVSFSEAIMASKGQSVDKYGSVISKKIKSVMSNQSDPDPNKKIQKKKYDEDGYSENSDQ